MLALSKDENDSPVKRRIENKLPILMLLKLIIPAGAHIHDREDKRIALQWIRMKK